MIAISTLWRQASECLWRNTSQHVRHNARYFSWLFVRSTSTLYVVTKYGIFLSVVTGPSMLPTFDGQCELVLVEAFSTYWLHHIQVGDVIIATRPYDPSQSIIKRVTATEGEGVLLYPDRSSAELRHVTVPPGHVWVQGDNLARSLDSREYGPIPVALVKGRAFLQVWPTIKPVGREVSK